MQLSGNTILITGGSAGIGLELAAEFIARNNVVIVTGRDAAKLAAAKIRLPALHVIQSDVADPAAITALGDRLIAEFPELNVLVNNAGVMKKINLHAATEDLARLTVEIEINLMGPIRMVARLLTQLKSRPHAAIVNVTSAVASTPLAVSPVYSATKAGLHSYTQSLRSQLKGTDVRVFELAPPGVDTALLRDEFTLADIGGSPGMDVRALARATIAGLGKDQLEIRPGLSRALNVLSRVAPEFAVRQLSKSVDAMLAQNKPKS